MLGIKLLSPFLGRVDVLGVHSIYGESLGVDGVGSSVNKTVFKFGMVDMCGEIVDGGQHLHRVVYVVELKVLGLYLPRFRLGGVGFLFFLVRVHRQVHFSTL